MLENLETAGAVRTSDLIRSISDDPPETITIRQILEHLGGRSYGGLFLILSLLSPIPGVGVGASALLFVLALQMAFGRAHPYCPARLADHEFKPVALTWSLRRILPVLIFAERFVKLRYDRLTRRPFDLAIGFSVCLLALVVVLPLPFLNLLPSAAVLVIALAVLERDGLVLIVGGILFLATFLVVDLLLIAAATTAPLIWG